MTSTASPRYPCLYQINTRVRLTELSRVLGRAATLDDFDDAELDRLAALGFDWIWLLSVWQTGAAARRVSRDDPTWRTEFEQTLPDLCDDDIAGSGFVIQDYVVHTDLGGDAALARLRERLHQRGLKLMLDFVPNHVAPDHPWVEAYPEFFMAATEGDLLRTPKNCLRVATPGGARLVAHGRDPSLDSWPGTVQLNYAKAQLQQAMIGELQRIAGQCDGLLCDRATLVLPEVFERTWGVRSQPFWPKATAAVRHGHPAFTFVAEVCCDLEWTLQQQGFDFTCDKRLYDRLREQHAPAVRERMSAGLDHQDRLARFLENPDSPRAAATFAPDQHAAAAVIAYCTPGLRLLHQGQLEGRRVQVSPHSVRAPDEPVDALLARFYTRLLAVLRHPLLRDGRWSLLDIEPAWPGNPSSEHFIAWCWEGSAKAMLCVVVNYSAQQAQCFVRLPMAELAGRTCRLSDLLGDVVYERAGDELLGRGLFLDLPPWGRHVFELRCPN